MTAIFTPATISIMSSVSNVRWQTSKERPNVSPINGDMDDKAKRDVIERGSE